MENIKQKIESIFFERFITIIIIFNAVTLGLETHKGFSNEVLYLLITLDKTFLVIFIIEIVLKLFVYRNHFLKDAWRIFDFLIIAIAIIPSGGSFSVLRSLRILRTLRMLSVVPSLKKVVDGLLQALPGLGAVSGIISLIFYVNAVMATKLFGAKFPEWFGNIWESSYSLFQIMTLESWSMGIVRPVLKEYPYAWIFFIPFILVTTFTTLNLFIAVIVNAMQAETDSHAEERAEKGHDERVDILNELREIKNELKYLKNK